MYTSKCYKKEGGETTYHQIVKDYMHKPLHL